MIWCLALLALFVPADAILASEWVAMSLEDPTAFLATDVRAMPCLHLREPLRRVEHVSSVPCAAAPCH